MFKKKTLAAMAIGGISVLGLSAAPAHAVTDGTISANHSMACDVQESAAVEWHADPSAYKTGMTTEGGTQIDPNDERAGQLAVDIPGTTDPSASYSKMSRWVSTDNGVPTMHLRYAWAASDHAMDNVSASMYIPTQGWTPVASSDARSPENDDNAAAGISWSYGTPSRSSFSGVHFTDSHLNSNTGHFYEETIPVSQLTDQFMTSATTSGTYTDKTLCEAPLPKPDTDVAVNGVNNDTVTWPTSISDYFDPDNPPAWVDGKMVVTVADPEGRWYHLPDGTWTQTVNVTLTDSGVWPIKTTSVPTTTTVTVPVTTTKTTCSDPSVTVQVDSYTPTTAKMVNTLKADVARKTLGYRLDGPLAGNLAALTPSTTDKATDYASLWGHSSTEFVTVKESTIKAVGMQKAIDNATSKLPNLGGTIAVGKTFTDAWVLGSGATAAQPWGAKNAVNQTQWDVAVLPKPACTTSSVTTNTTKQVTTYKNVTSTVTPVVAPPTYTDAESHTGGSGGMGG